jgi:hypothetical protein
MVDFEWLRAITEKMEAKIEAHQRRMEVQMDTAINTIWQTIKAVITSVWSEIEETWQSGGGCPGICQPADTEPMRSIEARRH